MTAPHLIAPRTWPELPDWMDGTQPCAGHVDEMFPGRGASTRQIDEAKAYCWGCHHRLECLEYALANGEHWGIWGGTSERERRKIRKARREGTVSHPDVRIGA